MRTAVEKDMAELVAKMDLARQALGPYLMFYVRNIFPPEQSPLFDLIGQRLEEKITAQKSTGGPSWGAAFGGKLAEAKPATPKGDQDKPAAAPPEDSAKPAAGASWLSKDIGSSKKDT